MTRDHRRKKAVRAHAAVTGRTYLDADTSLRASRSGTAVLAAQLRDDLVAALEAAGWPVVVEHNPQFHALPVYAGPAVVHIARTAEPSSASTGDEHPDDPDVFDLDAPLRVTVWAPLTVEYSEELKRVVGVDAHELPADRSAGEIVAEIDRVVAEARRRDLADTPANAECGICGDSYPADGLIQPTRVEVSVCPCCAFDGDLLGPRPAQLAFYLDHAASQNLAVPAGWAGAQALLCCLGGPELPDWLAAEWSANGTHYLPREWWADPAQTWVWLPPTDRRPAALANLGCGASLTHITAAIDRAHPNLRTACRDRRDAELDEFVADEYGEDVHDPEAAASREALRASDATFARIWPAAVAYTVAMLTQQAERPKHRSPWHVLQSFELPDWVDALVPGLDHYHVETVLRGGILTIRDALDPREPEDRR